VYSPHLGRSQEYIFGFFLFEKVRNGRLIAQVEFAAAAKDKLVVTALTECPQQGGSDHSVVACNVNSGIWIHGAEEGFAAKIGDSDWPALCFPL
jgi:hypothetical protein